MLEMDEWKGKGFFLSVSSLSFSHSNWWPWLCPCQPFHPSASDQRKFFVLLPPELDLHGHGWCVSEIRCRQLVTTATPMPRLICLNRATEKNIYVHTFVSALPSAVLLCALCVCVYVCVHVVRLQITSEPHSDDANQMVACVEIFESVCVCVLVELLLLLLVYSPWNRAKAKPKSNLVPAPSTKHTHQQRVDNDNDCDDDDADVDDDVVAGGAVQRVIVVAALRRAMLSSRQPFCVERKVDDEGDSGSGFAWMVACLPACLLAHRAACWLSCVPCVCLQESITDPRAPGNKASLAKPTNPKGSFIRRLSFHSHFPLYLNIYFFIGSPLCGCFAPEVPAPDIMSPARSHKWKPVKDTTRARAQAWECSWREGVKERQRGRARESSLRQGGGQDESETEIDWTLAGLGLILLILIETWNWAAAAALPCGAKARIASVAVQWRRIPWKRGEHKNYT